MAADGTPTRAPRSTSRAALSGLRATTVMPSPFTVALDTRWVRDGTAEAMRDAIRREAQARQTIAAQALAYDIPVLSADAKLNEFGIERIW